jgi:hypothetical protein
MLAYVFWHRPRAGVDIALYEEAQQSFHASLEAPSACFHVAELPFAGEDGYEDWYLVEDWNGLGELNRSAVDAERKAAHNLAASMSADGWGSVYSLVRGPAAIPEAVDWRDKPRGEASKEFVVSLPETTIWQRQMVLGPAPELCVATSKPDRRRKVWPTL